MATKEELILRALDTTNMATQIHEDLSDLITMITPKDVPLFQRLKKTKATALLHEWTETSLNNGFTAGKYADGGVPADNTHNHNRLNNKVMSIGRVAKATGLLRATNLVGQVDALARELEEKMIDITRVIEYYIYNGDKTVTSPQEMDGLAKILTAGNGAQAIDNRPTAGTGANTVVSEANLKALITSCYNAGGAPNVILARPSVAYAIASFTDQRIRYTEGGGAAGVGKGALRYLSPFGEMMEVVPVRTDFLPSGSVFVLQEEHLALPYLSNGIEVEDLAHSTDAVSKLIKAYLTLEVRAIAHHGVLTNVADLIS